MYNSGIAVIDCIHASNEVLVDWLDPNSNACQSHFRKSDHFKLLQKHAIVEVGLRSTGKARQVTRSEWKTLYIHTQRELVELRHPGAWALWVEFENSESRKYLG